MPSFAPYLYFIKQLAPRRTARRVHRRGPGGAAAGGALGRAAGDHGAMGRCAAAEPLEARQLLTVLPAGFAETQVGTSDFVSPTAQVRVRFTTQDTPNNSTTEAGVDAFHVDKYICQANPCPADIAPVGAPDGVVGPGDLGQLLASWGACAGCAADIAPVGAPDGVVGPGDLGQLLASWGQCK